MEIPDPESRIVLAWAVRPLVWNCRGGGGCFFHLQPKVGEGFTHELANGFIIHVTGGFAVQSGQFFFKLLDTFPE